MDKAQAALSDLAPMEEDENQSERTDQTRIVATTSLEKRQQRARLVVECWGVAYELGKYVDVGAGDWIVALCQGDRFNTRKEHRDWLKSNPGPKGHPCFEVGEVIIANVSNDDGGYSGIKYAVLVPSLLFKDEKRAFYHLPSQDHVKGKKITRTPKKLELVDHSSKGPKKKSTKTTKGSKKK